MKVAILGGGVAGISTAIALKQRGFDVVVYERHQGPSNMGAGIVVWPNAAFVLDQLGVLGEVVAVSGYPTKMQRFSKQGENLGAIDIDAINQQMGYASVSVLRKDFQDILLDQLASLGVAVHYGHTVSHIETAASGDAVAVFQDGTPICADVIVGADGRMASAARLYVHGDNAPVYQGFINWVGVYESEEPTFEAIAVEDYWGVGERFGIVPITNNKAYWAAGVACAELGPNNPAAYQAELHDLFGDWPEPVQQMIERTPVDRINKIYVHDHDPIPSWHKNNLIVIGDAAHAPLPTSGQGACQALEDAWHLANILGDKPQDLHQAWVKFTELRVAKTSGITMAARGFASSLFNPDENFCAARNENSKNTDFAQVAAAMARGWSQHLPLKHANH